MSRLFTYNGHLLLYIQAMRICLFPGSQIIENSFLGHAVVLVVLISLIYLAYRNSSQILAILVWLMAVITAIADGSTHFMLSLMLGISAFCHLFCHQESLVDRTNGLHLPVLFHLPDVDHWAIRL